VKYRAVLEFDYGPEVEYPPPTVGNSVTLRKTGVQGTITEVHEIVTAEDVIDEIDRLLATGAAATHVAIEAHLAIQRYRSQEKPE
jgi:hypothetical protein